MLWASRMALVTNYASMFNVEIVANSWYVRISVFKEESKVIKYYGFELEQDRTKCLASAFDEIYIHNRSQFSNHYFPRSENDSFARGYVRSSYYIYFLHF